MTLRDWGDEVAGVEAAAEAGEVCVHARAAGAGAIGVLEDEERRAFAEQRAVALDVVRAAGARREHPGRVELAHVPPGDGVVEAAGDGDVRLAAAAGADRAPDRGGADPRAPRKVGFLFTQAVRGGDVNQRR